jgi:HEAT repeat protein
MSINAVDQIADLITGFYHPDKEYRAESVQKIVQYGEEATPVLVNLLNHPDWKVRYRAAETLGVMRSKVTVLDLIPLCKDKKDHVRYMAAKALGNIRDARAVPILVHLLTDDHSYTRGIAATGLAVIGNTDGKSAIESALLLETDPSVREKMIQSLKVLDKK